MSNSEARQALRDSISILNRRSGSFRATRKFVSRLEGTSVAVSNALASADISLSCASEQSRRTLESIRARQS